MDNPYEKWVNLVCESGHSKERYLLHIKQFEEWARRSHGLEVKETPAKWREIKYESAVEKERFIDGLQDVLKDYFTFIKGAGYTPLSVNQMVSTVVSYLHAYEIPVKPIRIRHSYVQYHNRDITKEELYEILNHSDVRDKAAFLVLYESGMRPNTLVNLRWRHVKDEFLAHKIPMKIELTSDILKCRVSERWTFIGEEGFEALKRYVPTRGHLREDDYVFLSEKPAGQQLTRNALSQRFGRIVDLLEIAKPPGKGKPKPVRLYCLRKAFRKFMASSIDNRYVEYWMGHTNTETHYLSSDVEHHRGLYAKGYENLRLQKPQVNQAVMRIANENKELKEKMLQVEGTLGYYQERVKRLEDVVDLLRKTLEERDSG